LWKITAVKNIFKFNFFEMSYKKNEKLSELIKFKPQFSNLMPLRDNLDLQYRDPVVKKDFGSNVLKNKKIKIADPVYLKNPIVSKSCSKSRDNYSNMNDELLDKLYGNI
jgi:hypothetical protein